MSLPPRDWYPDPEDASLQRFWDGEAWTSDRRPVPPGTAALGTAAPFSPPSGRLSRGLGAAKRLADNAKQTAAAQRASGAAALVGQAVADVAKDPAKRAAVIAGAAPIVDAALDGAGVRNKKGKVKVWRLARAAARPRKTVARVTSGVASTSAGRILDAARESHARHTVVPPTIESIAAEWEDDDLGADLERWRQGVDKFAEADAHDPSAMRECALLMCAGLKHCLTGPPPIDDDDQIVETAGDVLVAGLRATSGFGLDADLSAALRLALAIARRFGVQPEALGGNGELDLLFEDSDSRMKFAMALAPTPWSCDIAPWFADA